MSSIMYESNRSRHNKVARVNANALGVCSSQRSLISL